MKYHIFAHKPESTLCGSWGYREDYYGEYIAKINLTWDELADALSGIYLTNSTLREQEDGFLDVHILSEKGLMTSGIEEIAQHPELDSLHVTANLRAQKLKVEAECEREAAAAAERAKDEAEKLEHERKEFERLKAKFDAVHSAKITQNQQKLDE